MLLALSAGDLIRSALQWFGVSGPIQVPQVPGVNLPKVGATPTSGSNPTDQRTNQALLDYLMGN